MAQAKAREQWSGQAGFIVAAIGSAVGLGNIWRFPGVAYENGGGAFLIPYLIALLTAGLPILFLDYAVGHRFRGTPPLAFRRIARSAEPLGWYQVGICFIITVYYAAVIAWAGSYFVFSFGNQWGADPQTFLFEDYLQLSGPEVSTRFVPAVLIPLVLVWVVCLVVLAGGVAKGLGRANLFFLPLLILCFIALVIRALFLPGAVDGLDAFFTPNWGALLDPQVWIAAYSQIFFSLSVAFGIMVTYASYLRRRSNLTGAGLVVGFANSSFEMLAGIGVFATLGFMAHQQGVAVGELEGLMGVALAFITFPAIISQMPGGLTASIFGALFFGSLVMAGFTSILSLLQVISGAVQDKFGFTPRAAACWVCGVLGVISVGLFSTASGLIALDTVDKWANEVGIVSSAIIASVLVFWVFRRGPELTGHLNAVSTVKLGRIWVFLASFAAPLVLLAMLVLTLVPLMREGYEGYPTWYLVTFGWGAIALIIVAAFVLAAVPWRHLDPSLMKVWPPRDQIVRKER